MAIEHEGTTHQRLVSIDAIEFLAPDEWMTPHERAVAAIEETIDYLYEEVSAATIAQACWEVGETVHDIPELTARKPD